MFDFRIGDEERAVAITKSGAGWTLTIDERDVRVESAALVGNELRILSEGRSLRVLVSKADDGLNLTLHGETYHVDTGGDQTRASSGGGAGDGKLEAPMPGNIVGLPVSEGDEVAAGQPIVILESMKMQNEIAATVAGRVKAIHCAVGDQVGFGDLLAEIEPIGEPT